MRNVVAATIACLSLVGLSTASDVQASIKKEISIPAGGLGPALRTFSEAQHIHVVFISEDVGALHTRGASGSLTVDEALTQILNGTGLTYRYIDAETVSIVPVATQPKATRRTDGPMGAVDASRSTPTHSVSETQATGTSKGLWRRLRLAQVDTSSQSTRRAPSQSAAQSATDAASPAATAGDANKLEEVIVTAQFRRTDLQKTPLAITAVTGEMLDARGIVNMTQVATTAPNVSLTPARGDFGRTTAAYVRGIGQSDFSPAFEPGVGIYIDDVYYSTIYGSAFDLMDPQRVEILRGPQGTLAGRNSIGGAVKFYSQPPTADGGGYLDVRYGSYRSLDLRGAADFPALDNKVLVRVTGMSRENGGFIERRDYACSHPVSGVPSDGGDDCKLGTLGGVSETGGRIFLRVLPTDRLSVDLITDYTRGVSDASPWTLRRAGLNPIDQQNYAPYVPSDPYVSYATFTGGAWNPPPANYHQDGGVSATVDYRLSDIFSLKSISAYRFLEGRVASDNDASPLGLFLVGVNLESNAFTQELRLSGRIDAFDFTVGGFYFENDILNGGRAYTTNVFDQNQADEVEGTSWATFGNLEYSATDNLRFIGGVRYTSDEKSYKFVRSAPPGVVEPPLGVLLISQLNGVQRSASSSNVDWRAGLQYQVTPEIMGYVQASTGYKGGGVNPRPFFATQVVPFRPEKVTSYEAGLKTRLFDDRAQVNLAAFFSNYTDLQVPVGSGPCFIPPGFPPFCALVVNGGSAHISGLEVETEVHPINGLTIDASASYLDFEYTSKNQFSNIGSTAPRTPRRKASLGIQYETSIGGAGTLTPRVDAVYQSEIFFDTGNNPVNHHGGYTLVNAKLIWRSASAKWQTTAGVTNLTDKLYYTSISDYTNLFNFVVGDPAPPRKWEVSLRRSF